MAYFESGVKEYIKSYAVVEVGFPVDFKGSVDKSCYQCKFFSRNNGVCQLTKEVTAYPKTNVGDACPLVPIEEEE